MGVPKFYRWVSERYPLINRKIGSDPRFLPRIDNFYLDLNGIIHNCSHPDDTDDSLSKVLSFEEICANIELLVDKMVQTVHPSRLLYITIDGCAPRAKLNQQRSRRFATARSRNKILEEQRKKQSKAKKNSQNEVNDFFDSNVITPGTEFMADLDIFLQDFIERKIKSDPVWSRLEVIYSGHDVPGEGEHKIMEYIRVERRKPDYDSNTRHCCNSLDADLIMLGLASHEKRFCLLREEVDFNQWRGQNGSLKTKEYCSFSTDLENWEMLDLSCLRQYLKLEFNSYFLNKLEPFLTNSSIENERETETVSKINHEKIIDDLVVLISILGNDFLPHIQGIEIRNGSLDLIIELYKEVLFSSVDFSSLESNTDLNLKFLLSEKNKIDLNTLMIVFEKLAEKERSHFKVKRNQKNSQETLPSYKKKYYERCFNVDFKTGDNIQKVNEACISFVKGMIWCFEYYYFGVSSWTWFYPFHYAPLVSDLASLRSLLPGQTLDTFFSSETLTGKERHVVINNLQAFTLGKPLKPFVQLMCCLPPQSSHALPSQFSRLMTHQKSPLKKFYPLDFELDMNGKRFDYEAINLIPFVIIEEVQSAVDEFVDVARLSKKEQNRNTFSHTVVFKADGNLRSVIKKKLICPHKVEGIIHQVSEEVEEEGFFGGDPNLSCLRTNMKTSKLLNVGLNLFGRPSQKDTFLLNITLSNDIYTFCEKYKAKLKQEGKFKSSQEEEDFDEVSVKVIVRHLNDKIKQNKFRKLRCWINVPYLVEAELVSIFDRECKYSFSPGFKDRRRGNPNSGYVIDRQKLSEHHFDMVSERVVDCLKFGCQEVGTGGFDISDSFFDLFVEVIPKSNIAYNYEKRKFFDLFQGKKITLPVQMITFANSANDKYLKASYYNQLTQSSSLFQSLVLNATQGSSYKEKLIVLNNIQGYQNSYGLVGEVVGTKDGEEGEIILNVEQKQSEQRALLMNYGHNISNNVKEKYYSTREASARLRMSPTTIGKIASSVKVRKKGVSDIGLNLKGGKKYKTPGFTRGAQGYAHRKGYDLWKSRKVEKDVHGVLKSLKKLRLDESNGNRRNGDDHKSRRNENDRDRDREIPFYWEYSEQAVRVMEEYKEKFPTVIECVERNPDKREYFLDDLFPVEAFKKEPKEPKLSKKLDEVLEEHELLQRLLLNEDEEENEDVLLDAEEEEVDQDQMLEDVFTFLKTSPWFDLPLVPVESNYFTSKQIKTAKLFLKRKGGKGRTEKQQLKIKPSDGVSFTALKCHKWFDTPTSYSKLPRLGDRVCNMSNRSIDFGKQGIIFATHPLTRCVEILFDDLKTKILRYSQVVNLSQPQYISSNVRNQDTVVRTARSTAESEVEKVMDFKKHLVKSDTQVVDNGSARERKAEKKNLKKAETNRLKAVLKLEQPNQMAKKNKKGKAENLKLLLGVQSLKEEESVQRKQPKYKILKREPKKHAVQNSWEEKREAKKETPDVETKEVSLQPELEKKLNQVFSAKKTKKPKVKDSKNKGTADEQEVSKVFSVKKKKKKSEINTRKIKKPEDLFNLFSAKKK